jgi:hypothetical protein
MATGDSRANSQATRSEEVRRMKAMNNDRESRYQRRRRGADGVRLEAGQVSPNARPRISLRRRSRSPARRTGRAACAWLLEEYLEQVDSSAFRPGGYSTLISPSSDQSSWSSIWLTTRGVSMR